MKRINGRKAVAAAFRRIARGVEAKVAYRMALAFYRATGLEWTKRLG